MPQTTQANDDSIKEADAHAQGLDGGLNLKTDPSRLAPPATTRNDNAWYTNPGNVGQLPALSTGMQANTSHVYNIHARDLQQPASVGDLMVHGEVLDTVSTSAYKFTSPVWTDGNGQTINTQQPMPPFTARTKVLTGKFNRTPYGGPEDQNMMTAKQESGYTAASPQRYALGYHDGNTLRVTYGLVDGQVETPETLTVSQSANYSEMAAVQGTNYFAWAWINGASLNVWMYDFKGNPARPGIQVSSTALNVNNGNSGSFAPFTLLQHAGRTYLVYITNPSGNPCVVTFYDIVSGASVATPLSSSNASNYGFSAASPYTHQTPPASTPFYVAIQFCNQVYLLSQTSVGGAFSIAGNGVALPQASTTGYGNSGSQPVNWFSTLACTIFDSIGGYGGYGTTCSIGVVCFRHYPEQVSTSWNTTYYQSVSVSTFSWQATAGLNTSSWQLLYNNFVRMPSGCAIASKAFTLNPPEVGYAGLKGAKNAYCMIRCGAFEPYAGLSALYTGSGYGKDWTYGQPTFFVIDHQGRIVSRAFEGQGPMGYFDGSAYALANQGYMAGSSGNYGYTYQAACMGAPLLTATNSDCSVLDITLPCWVQTQANPGVAFQLNTNVVNFTPPPTDVVFQPAALVLSISSQAVLCPPVQAGSYTVLSGPMTCVHDGRGVVEANYHFGTNNPAVTGISTNTYGNTGPAGTYYYAVTWEWQDSLGRVHRATPSVPVGAYFSGFFGQCTVVAVPPVTVKSAVGGLLLMRVYRSLVNTSSGIFYQIGTMQVSAYGSGNNYVTFVDNGSVYDPQGTSYAGAGGKKLDAQPRLYIQLSATSGLLTYPAQQPPPFIWQSGTKGRSFGIAQIFGQHRLFYTSVAQDRFPFEWHSQNYAPIPPDIGDVRSVEAIDDKLIIFGTRSNAVINGDGPASANTLGTPAPGDGFSLVQPIPTPVGVIGSGAPARIPDGIVFQGFSGIQLVGRDLSVQPIGAAVDLLTGRQVGNVGTVFGRAVTLASLQSVVWCNPNGAPLVYNYLTQKWSTWPIMAGLAAMVQRLDGSVAASLQPISAGQYATAATASTPGADLGLLSMTWNPVYQGNAQQAGLVLESPWILPSGESGGESQLWDVTVTGGWLAPHILQVEQAYNYVSQYTAQTQFSVPTAPKIYQFRVRPKSTARVWAVRYRITVLPISSLSTAYDMVTLGDLVLNYGSKQGTSRLGAAASG